MAEQENLNPVVIPDSAINQTYPSLPGTEPTISIVNHPDLDKKEETPPSKKVSRQILSGVIHNATQSQISNNIMDNDYTMNMDNNNTQNNTDNNDISMNIPRKPEPQMKNNNDIPRTTTNTVQHFLPSPSNSPSSGPDTPQEQLLNDTIMPDLEPQTSNNTMITNNNSNNNGSINNSTINNSTNDNDNMGNNGIHKDGNTNHNDNISHITHDSNSNTSNKNINNNNNNINVTHSGSNNGNHNPTNIRKRRSSSITSQNGRATKRLKIERRIRDRSWEAQALKQFEKLAKTLKAEWSYFSVPVDEVAHTAPNYHLVCPFPSDFGTIQDKLGKKGYKNIDEFLRECELVFINARMYNSNQHFIHTASLKLEKYFKQYFNTVINKYGTEFGSTQTVAEWNKSVKKYSPFSIPASDDEDSDIL